MLLFVVVALSSVTGEEEEVKGEFCSSEEDGGSECCTDPDCGHSRVHSKGEPRPRVARIQDGSEGKWERYFQEVRKYSDLVEGEEEEERCWGEGVCGCYDKVIESDLRVWRERGGITKKEFEAAKTHGVHYQMVNHTLYRQQHCTFPARSAVN